MENQPHHTVQYLVQRFTSIDEKGDGAWISLKMFPAREQAEKFQKELQLAEDFKIRVIEAV